MTTDTKLNQLIINKLTQEQYDEAKAAGTLSDTELYITDSDDDALTNTNITNCITEIPQDIKLELNNGTLTLKAGSKLYVPNGAGVFNSITTTSDIKIRPTGGSGKVLISINSTGTVGAASLTTSCVSGAGVTPKDYGLAYDTTTNIITRYGASGSISYNNSSFPLAVCSQTNEKITSIDQVFNGFGYIGSTVFALPGVKGLIPNGRNADGSLKNIEVEFTNVKTQTFPSNLSLDVVFGAGTSDVTANGAYKYDEQNNYNYDGSTIWPRCYYAIGHLTNGRITSFTPKTVFHAVDYNDFSDLKNTVGIPSQTGQSGKFLTTNGTTTSWGKVKQIEIKQDLTNPSADTVPSTKAVSDESSRIVSIMNNLLSTLYPVGSIYIGTQNNCPLASLIAGSQWQIVATQVVTKVNTGVAVYGNGRALGLTNSQSNGGLTFTRDGARTWITTNAYNSNIGTGSSNGVGWNSNTSVGVVRDAATSGLTGSLSHTNLSLNIWKRTA